MRYVSFFVAIAACMAQSNLTPSRGGYDFVGGVEPVAAHRDSAVKYLVEYVTTEPCYECGSRYLINCAPSSPDCNVPTKGVVHFDEFESKAEAIEFLNAGMERAACISVDYSGTGHVGCAPRSATTGVAYPRAFGRLWEIKEVAVEVTAKETEVQQPPVKVETKRYSVK